MNLNPYYFVKWSEVRRKAVLKLAKLIDDSLVQRFEKSIINIMLGTDKSKAGQGTCTYSAGCLFLVLYSPALSSNMQSRIG